MPRKVNKVMAKFLYSNCYLHYSRKNSKSEGFYTQYWQKNLNGHKIDNQALEIVIRNKAIKVCKTCLLKLESDWFLCICLFILR